MESEKVKEIKKALEVYGNENKGITILRGGEIQAIPYTDILTLINELESENEKLKNEYLTQARLLGQMGYNDIQECKKLKERIAELEKENGKLNIELDKRDCIDYPCRLIEKEHLKQFAERLKERLVDKIGYDKPYVMRNINETLKEMLGEE